MLKKLEIENFYSVRDRMVIDLTVPSKTPSDPRFAVIEEEDDLRIKKVLCLFGPNASGKTTILRAISYLKVLITESFEFFKSDSNTYTQPFDIIDGDHSVTKLAIEFIVGKEFRSKWLTYRYEVEIAQCEPHSYIALEVLKAAKPKSRFVTLFRRSREGNEYVTKAHSSFELPDGDPRAKPRHNVSLISNLLQFDHRPAEEFANIMRNSFHNNLLFNRIALDEDDATKYLVDHPQIKDEMRRIIRKIDVGITDFSIDERNGENIPFFQHSGLKAWNPLFFESQGTRNFYCLFPILAWGKMHGATAVIDELDSDLHPHLVSEIIRWFQRNDESDPYSQLITCLNHPSVMHQLEKEEVGLVWKDGAGRTTFQDLSAFEGLRRDANLYKKYMGGSFGAIPAFG